MCGVNLCGSIDNCSLGFAAGIVVTTRSFEFERNLAIAIPESTCESVRSKIIVSDLYLNTVLEEDINISPIYTPFEVRRTTITTCIVIVPNTNT